MSLKASQINAILLLALLFRISVQDPKLASAPSSFFPLLGAGSNPSIKIDILPYCQTFSASRGKVSRQKIPDFPCFPLLRENICQPAQGPLNYAFTFLSSLFATHVRQQTICFLLSFSSRSLFDVVLFPFHVRAMIDTEEWNSEHVARWRLDGNRKSYHAQS